MSTVGLKLRELRNKAGFSLRKAAVAIDIDVAILSKMERGERKFSKELVLKLAELYKTNSDKLVIDYLSEKVLYELKEEEFGLEALKVAEQQLKYIKKNNVKSRKY
jgi:transcriptional regulator with XRE-family HTH domain